MFRVGCKTWVDRVSGNNDFLGLIAAFLPHFVHTLNSYSCRSPLGRRRGSVIGHGSLLLDDVRRACAPAVRDVIVGDVISRCAAASISVDVIPVASDNSLRRHSTST